MTQQDERDAEIAALIVARGFSVFLQGLIAHCAHQVTRSIDPLDTFRWQHCEAALVYAFHVRQNP